MRQVLTSTKTQSLEVHVAESGRRVVIHVVFPSMKPKKAQFYYHEAFFPKQKESKVFKN